MTNEQAIKRFETALNYIQEQYATFSENEKAFRNDMCNQTGMPTYEETFEMYQLAIQALQNEKKRLELLNETKLKLKLSRNKGWTKSETILLNIIHALEMLEGVEVSDEE